MRYEVTVTAQGSTTVYWLDAEDERQAMRFAYQMWVDDNPRVPDGIIEDIQVRET